MRYKIHLGMNVYPVRTEGGSFNVDLEKDKSKHWPPPGLTDIERGVNYEIVLGPSSIVRRYISNGDKTILLVRCPPNPEGIKYYVVREWELQQVEDE